MAELADAGQLYVLPLDDFTAARNELAKQLRNSGDHAAADQVKGLPKPSITAWALNQVARSQPNLVDGLLASADELRRAQQQLLAGRNPASFRTATQQERQAVNAVVRAAADVLTKDGHPAGKTTLDRLEATARAAAAGEQNGDLLRAGRLSRDLDPSGFGHLALGGFGTPAEPIPFPARPKGAPQAKPAPPPGADEQTKRQESEKRQRELVEARKASHDLQQQLAALRKDASEAERAAASARQAATKADRAWAEAREATARAEKEAERGHRTEEEARQDLAALRVRIDQTAEQLVSAEETLRSLRN